MPKLTKQLSPLWRQSPDGTWEVRTPAGNYTPATYKEALGKEFHVAARLFAETGCGAAQDGSFKHELSRHRFTPGGRISFQYERFCEEIQNGNGSWGRWCTLEGHYPNGSTTIITDVQSKFECMYLAEPAVAIDWYIACMSDPAYWGKAPAMNEWAFDQRFSHEMLTKSAGDGEIYADTMLLRQGTWKTRKPSAAWQAKRDAKYEAWKTKRAERDVDRLEKWKSDQAKKREDRYKDRTEQILTDGSKKPPRFFVARNKSRYAWLAGKGTGKGQSQGQSSGSSASSSSQSRR